MRLTRRLHQGRNDKYFLLANTGWRSLSRFGLNVLVAKLAGAETYSTLVLLITFEVIVTTLLSAWLVTPMLNVGSGTPAAVRHAMGKYTLVRSVKWAGMLGLLVALAWGILGFTGAGPVLAIGFLASAFMACLLQALRAWRAVCFESWHVFWADLIAFGFPLAAVITAYVIARPSGVLAVLVWSSAAGALLAMMVMVGSSARPLLAATKLHPEFKQKMAEQSVPLLIGSIANTVGTRAYPILLAGLTVSLEVARFGAAMTLIGPMRMIGMALSGVIRTRFALYYNQNDTSRVRVLMLKVSLAVCFVSLVMFAAIAWRGDQLCGALFGDWFRGSRLLLLAGVWYGTVSCLGSFVVTALQTQSKEGPAYTAKLRTAVSVITVLLAAVSMGWYGAIAPMLAMALTETVYLGLALRRWSWTDGRIAEAISTNPA